jgi:hypothetical protein
MNKQPDRESIRAMQPGRELDALVEQYVFGNKVRWVQDLITDQYPVSDQEGYIVDYYSTDISVAWGVVEKMQENQWDFTLKNHKRLVHKRQYEAIFGTPYSAFAITAPEAICKAALLAVMEGEEPRG